MDAWAGQGQVGQGKELGYFPKATWIHWKQGSTMNDFFLLERLLGYCIVESGLM